MNHIITPFKKSAIFEISPALAANQTPAAEPERTPCLAQERRRDYFTSHLLLFSSQSPACSRGSRARRSKSWPQILFQRSAQLRREGGLGLLLFHAGRAPCNGKPHVTHFRPHQLLICEETLPLFLKDVAILGHRQRHVWYFRGG